MSQSGLLYSPCSHSLKHIFVGAWEARPMHDPKQFTVEDKKKKKTCQNEKEINSICLNRASYGHVASQWESQNCGPVWVYALKIRDIAEIFLLFKSYSYNSINMIKAEALKSYITSPVQRDLCYRVGPH